MICEEGDYGVNSQDGELTASPYRVVQKLDWDTENVLGKVLDHSYELWTFLTSFEGTELLKGEGNPVVLSI